MPIVETLEKALEEFPTATPDPRELARLQQFLAEMKDAGVAKTREYNLPRPDTIGRSPGGQGRLTLTSVAAQPRSCDLSTRR